MRRYLFSVLVLALTLAACSPGQVLFTLFSSQDDTDTVEPAAAYNGPAWTHFPLTNARTGETFTLADFAGKTVYLEPMATW